MELARALNDVASRFTDIVSKARENEYTDESFFEHIVRARVELLTAVEYMFAYGKLDPETYSKIMREQIEEPLKKLLGQ